MDLVSLFVAIPKIALFLLLIVSGAIAAEIFYFSKKRPSKTLEVSLPPVPPTPETPLIETVPTGPPTPVSPPSPPPMEKPRFSRKKKILTVGLIVFAIVLGGIPIVTAWKLRQAEKVTPGEAEAWVGNACSGDCEIVVGPGNLTFEAAGHGFRWHCLSKDDCELNGSEVKSADIYVPFPAGATVKEAYAIWSGEGCHTPSEDCAAENQTTVNINGHNTSASKIFVAQNTKYADNTQAANIAKLNPASIPSPEGGKLKFHVLSLNKFYANGHGISIIVIYEKPDAGYNKIILRLWGEWFYLACAPHDTRSGCEGPRSKVMSINLSDLDTTRANDNKFAWFAGEGEIDSRDTSKKFKACIDDEGKPRPSHLYYQTPGQNWTMLSATDSPPAPYAWFACPMDPGGWWVTRMTGKNMPQINLTGDSIKFAADSATAEGEQPSDGESYTFVGTVAQYPVEQPLLSCLNLTASPSAETLQKESSVNFICKGNSDASRTINHFEFRVSIDSGVPIDLGSTPAATVSGGYEGQKNYIVPDYGCYQVECRACTSSDSSACTAWGQAQ